MSAVARPWPVGALALVLASLSSCALRTTPGPPQPAFRFSSDTFAFANETVWEYWPNALTKELRWRKREPRPPFSLRCNSVVRAARLFHVQARFDPTRPAVDTGVYRELIAAVLRRDPRRKTPSPDPVIIPGYADLRAFSRDHAPLLKALLDRPALSLQRGHWRMIFPFGARGQRALAERLAAAVARGEAPVVHVLRYPDLTLNHFVLVYAVEETPGELRFDAYDPNDADQPLRLTWDRGARTFVYARTLYFPGGPIRAYEVYDGLLY